MTRPLKAFALSLLACVSSAASAAGDNPLDSERWRTRPLILVIPAASDPMLVSVQAALGRESVSAAFKEREMVLFTVIAGEGQREGRRLSTPQTRSLLDALGAVQDGRATAFLVGKDGGTKLTQRGELSLDAVFTLIDGMPMRNR